MDKLFAHLGVKLNQIGTEELKQKLTELDVAAVASELGVGVPTLRDIVGSLLRPGRDPREELPAPIFHTEVLNLEDLTAGMELQGTVRNVIDFGAFIDIGLKNDGLVHISQLSDKFVKHPMDVVSVGDTVTVWVLTVDVKKGALALRCASQVNKSLKTDLPNAGKSVILIRDYHDFPFKVTERMSIYASREMQHFSPS